MEGPNSWQLIGRRDLILGCEGRKKGKILAGGIMVLIFRQK
jgi:hypothetical protein